MSVGANPSGTRGASLRNKSRFDVLVELDGKSRGHQSHWNSL